VASYRLLINESAAKELEGLGLADRRRIVDRIRSLSENPRPAGSEKLSGQEKFRVRQGDFRILYEVSDPGLTVTIVRIGHRREVYRSGR